MRPPSPSRRRRALSPSDDQSDRIAVLRPQLPNSDRLLPYLRRIDAGRIYTNWGPLASELERQLSKRFSLPEGCVVSASSGTTALVGAILASAGRATADRPWAVIPSFAFVATALAAEQCGYRPYFVDVSAERWMVDLDQLDNGSLLDRTGLVVPVAAFGQPVAQDRAVAFHTRTRIPVVIDGGASFEAVIAEPGRHLGEVPVALSFHATKSFSTAEGGCVAVANAQLAASITRALNFGFYEDRRCSAPSTNGKMSEYHAAIGLAELETWTGKSAALCTVADKYRRRLNAAGLGDRFVAAPTVAGCYALFRCLNSDEADRVRSSLDSARIESRLWYGRGLHTHSYYHDSPRDSLEVTDRVAPLIIGLPVAPDLSDLAIERIVTALVAGLHGHL
jgi:dTDP-4-amino-4,6-dideoxygalactose transaminase